MHAFLNAIALVLGSYLIGLHFGPCVGWGVALLAWFNKSR